jgi:hypothetical protein
MIKRICFYGGPGAGKTTLAHDIFAYAKKQGKNCQIINELATEWAFVDRPIQSMDQIYLFASQLHREDSLLCRQKVDYLFTDSPILLSGYYSTKCEERLWSSLKSMIELFDEKFPALHFFCPTNTNYKFDREGRYHDSQQAKQIGEEMISFLYRYLDKKDLVILSEYGRLEQVIDVMKQKNLL